MNMKALGEIGNGKVPDILKGRDAMVTAMYANRKCGKGCVRWALLEDVETSRGLNPREAMSVLMRIAKDAAQYGFSDVVRDSAILMIAASKASGCTEVAVQAAVKKFGVPEEEARKVLADAPEQFGSGRSLHPDEASGIFMGVAETALELGFQKVAKAAASLMVAAAHRSGYGGPCEDIARKRYGLSFDEIREIKNAAPAREPERASL